MSRAPTGVPSPYTVHVHPYPTRFHGGQWVRPEFGMPWVRTPYAVYKPSDLNGLGNDDDQAFDVRGGVFRRPNLDGGGIFNAVSGTSGLGGVSEGVAAFMAAAAVAFVATYVVIRNKQQTPNRRRRNGKMTAAEKGRRVKEMNDRWYKTRAKSGAKAADAELDSAMREYYSEMDKRGGP